VTNKVAIHHVPLPGIILTLQLAVTVGFILVLRFSNLIEVDKFSWNAVATFIPYICSFNLSLYSNGRALAASNIETVIVFRALSPLCVSVLDWLFLGRELPEMRSVLALLGLVVGAVGYVMADSQFAVLGFSAYKWVCLNLAGIVFEMTYGKKLISGVQFRSPVWGATFYTNALALLPMLATAVTAGEAGRLSSTVVDLRATCWLCVSCVIGVGISWSGWNCRSHVSATAYTLLGVVCKLISVILNVVIWDKHASPRGMLWLLVCLVCSAAYKQAPLRTEPAETPRKEFDEENASCAEMKCMIGRETETDEEDGGGSTDAPPPSSNTSEESC
jgi:GDP-mannose transporter